MDLEHGNRSNEHSGTLLDGDRSIDVKQLEVLDGSDSDKYLRVKAISDEDDSGDSVVTAIPLGSSSSSSSSSSDSSSDLLQLNRSEDTSSITPVNSIKYDDDTPVAVKDDKNSVFGNSFFGSEESEHGTTASALTFQVSDVTQESMRHGMSPTESPSIQTMERSGGYDPSRIPSAVFERSKSTTPMEWSAASNESLFSIHVGTNSFSRDHLFMGKSGELTKSGELLMFSPMPPVPTREIERRNFEVDKDIGAEGVENMTIKDAAASESAEDLSIERVPPPVVSSMSSNLSIHSDVSVNSTRSFAFPIKKKKCAWKCAWASCYCSNCSWAFCYRTWPSCYFVWPSCHCSRCSWAFCYSWNCSCSLKRNGCHSPSALAGGLKTGSVKQNAVLKQQVESPASEPTPKATATANNCFPCSSWFSWCYSCPSCPSCHSCSCSCR